MSYVIFGRHVKNEYLAIGTMLSLVGASVFATGGKKEAPKPSGSSPKTLIEKVKDAVPLNASSSEEEQLMNSINKYIADAEKEAKH